MDGRNNLDLKIQIFFDLLWFEPLRHKFIDWLHKKGP